MARWRTGLRKFRVSFGTRTRRTLAGSVATAVANKLNARSATRTGTRTQTASSGSAPLTGQFDYKTDYSKRRKTRRQKKRITYRRKWQRRVLKTVREGNVGSVHLLKNSTATLTTTAGSSNAVSYGLNTLNGTASDAFNTANDIGEFLKEKDSGSWNNYNSVTLTEYTPYKMYLMHATMEMTIRNTHATNDALIEAYYIRGTRPLPSVWNNPTDTYVRGFYRQPRAADPDTGFQYDNSLVFSDIGVTPFQNSIFSKHYNIYKRQKFRIPPGSEINIVIHQPRHTMFSTPDTYPYATDRRYHGILFQQQGSPDITTTAQATSVTYLSVRRYRAKFIANNVVTDSKETTDP